MVANNCINKEAIYTANFIDRFDKIFNAVNSISPTGTRPMQYAISERFLKLVTLRIYVIVVSRNYLNNNK